MGVYIFERDALYRRLDEDAQIAGSKRDFGRDLVPEFVIGDLGAGFVFVLEAQQDIAARLGAAVAADAILGEDRRDVFFVMRAGRGCLRLQHHGQR